MTTSGDRDAGEPREPDRYDRDAVERAFADMVAGYHLTSDRPEPELRRDAGRVEETGRATEVSSTAWADDHPLFRYDGPDEVEDPDPEPTEHYEPPELEPLPRPAWPVLIGWLGMGYAVLVMLAVVVGVDLPSWAAWLGLGGFVAGFVILVAHLPRHRPPSDGDGAVV